MRLPRSLLAGRIMAAYLIGVVLGTAGPVAADPPQTTLTLRTTVGTGHERRTVLLETAGAPPSSTGSLVDASGLHAAAVTVTPLGTAECRRASLHHTGLGRDRWCLTISGIAAGQAYTGRLTGPGSAVTLSVSARHAFWPLPAMAALAALLLAVAAAFLTTRYLPDLVTNALLAVAIRTDGGIAGLSEWARQAAGRLAPADVLARVRWAKRYGGQRVQATRATLLEKASKLSPCPLRTASEQEAHRSDIVVGDLLTPGGTRATGIADALLDLVERAEQAASDFTTESAVLLTELADTDKRHAMVTGIIQQGQHAADGYLSQFNVDDYVSHLARLLDSIDAIIRPRPPQAEALAAAPPAVIWPAPAAQLATDTRMAARFAMAGGATLLTAAVLMIAAVISILTVQYLPNPTFGTATNYLTLAASAFSASTGAGILTVLLLIRGPQNWYG